MVHTRYVIGLLEVALWTMDNMPDQTGKKVVITGANSGIGFETAKSFLEKGADVLLACRSAERGDAALRALQTLGLQGKSSLLLLDLSSLKSIREFAQHVFREHEVFDILVNNAGVMIPPQSKTAEGYELQFGVNHLGHFALTALLYPLLRNSTAARIVHVSSVAHRFGAIDFDNLRIEKGYRASRAYAQSKLANLLFMRELHRQLHEQQSSIISVGAHPGGTKTELQRHNWFVYMCTQIGAMPTSQGALPSLYAATHPEVQGGEYYGPHAFFEMRGYPRKAVMSSKALDIELGKRLWKWSQEATGMKFLI